MRAESMLDINETDHWCKVKIIFFTIQKNFHKLFNLVFFKELVSLYIINSYQVKYFIFSLSVINNFVNPTIP